MSLKLKQRVAYVVAGAAAVGVALALTFTVGGVGSGKAGPPKLTPELAGELLVAEVNNQAKGALQVQILGCQLASPDVPRQYACLAVVAGQDITPEQSCGGFIFKIGADPMRKVTIQEGAPVDPSLCQ